MRERISKKSSVDKKVLFAYLAIILVVIVWGLAPLLTSHILQFYTASIYSATGALISGVTLLALCFPNLKQLNKDYLKIAVPTGLFNALANLLQKIGLQYTTPMQYAFLENLSCVIVPVLLYFFIKKKPSALTISASALCLVGCFALSGMNFSQGGIVFGKGEILCALAGVLYGVNIAATGAYAKKFNPALYVMVQTWVNVVVSFGSAIALNYVKLGGVIVEPLVFSWNVWHLFLLAVAALIVSTLCWIIRTNAMKYVSASVVAVMMPFSSVVTGVSSVAVGKDSLTLNLVLGGVLVLAASILSSTDDIIIEKSKKKMIKKYSYKKENQQNPYIGFTSFQHFRKDELYSDLIVKPENNMTETEHVECYPVPDYVEEKGRKQGYYPDCSVVYIRVLWKEFEPKECEYNYALIEEILQKARENGQTLMFRLMQHSTRESDDVPDWLKEKIPCPARPTGMRVKDCPSDPKFLYYFGRAIRAFGERFDKDPNLAFMDISLPGAWGEGSHVDLFTEEQLANFVDIYTDVFKNTLLIGQTCIPWLVAHSNKKTSMGWRADCIGRPDLTYEMLPPKVEKMGDIWKKGHVSFEAYWWLGEWQRQGWDLDKIIQILQSWHVSTFNAKSLPIPLEWKDKIDEWVAKMGYHFVIDEIETLANVKRGKKLSVRIVIDNVGVAPIYRKLPLYIRIKNETFEKSFETGVDIRKWIQGKYEEKIILTIPEEIPKGGYELQIGIGGKDVPSVVFATNAVQDGAYSVLMTLNIG